MLLFALIYECLLSSYNSQENLTIAKIAIPLWTMLCNYLIPPNNAFTKTDQCNKKWMYHSPTPVHWFYSHCPQAAGPLSDARGNRKTWEGWSLPPPDQSTWHPAGSPCLSASLWSLLDSFHQCYHFDIAHGELHAQPMREIKVLIDAFFK